MAHPTLRLGSTGPEVVRLQKLLNEELVPSPGLAADGTFGPKTAAAVRSFQSQNGLQADGVVGPATWQALEGGGGAGAPQSPVNPATAHINDEGVRLIKESESLRLTAYQDAVGIWTIGYGHTGPDVTPGKTITREQADALLRSDVGSAESDVRRLVKVPLSSNQFSALVSFVFNVGAGPTGFGGSTMLRLLNQGDYAGAADQFPRWNKAGGKVLQGLVKRRAAERALFLKP
jgi:lysozyme